MDVSFKCLVILVFTYTAAVSSYDFYVVSSTVSPLDLLNQKADKLQKAEAKTKDCQEIKPYLTSCLEAKNSGNDITGIYIIKPKASKNPLAVFCDMETHEGGWTYFLHRFDGSQDFFLKWNEYKLGFGSLTKEFWLGLDNLHQITNSEINEMLVEVTDWEDTTAYAIYDAFVIGNENETYILKALGAYSGTAGNSMNYYDGMKFSTQDRDNDLRSYGNCATESHGAWWYNGCTQSNPTGIYLKQAREEGYKYNIMYWNTFTGNSYSLKKMKIMVRPRTIKTSSKC